MLWPTDGLLGRDLDIEHTDLTHALEMGPNGVGVQIELLGDLGGAERPR